MFNERDPFVTNPVWLQVMSARPRRNRRSPALRAAFQETTVSPANFILPLFVHEGVAFSELLCCWWIIFVDHFLLLGVVLVLLLLLAVVASVWLAFYHLSLRFLNLSVLVFHSRSVRCVVVDSGEQNAPIGAMPGCQRLGWRHGLLDEVGFLFCLWKFRGCFSPSDVCSWKIP